MIRNHLIPENYVDMVKNFVAHKWDHISRSKRYFEFDDVVKYCYNKTQYFDEGDRERIRVLVRKTLQDMLDFGYISLCGGKYEAVKNVANATLHVEDDVPPMKFTKEKIDKLNEIGKNVDSMTYIP